MGIIYRQGTEIITIPKNEYLYIENCTGEHAKVYEKIYASNIPNDYSILYNTNQSNITIGPYTRDQEIKIESLNATINFNLSNTPEDEQTGSAAIINSINVSGKNEIINGGFEFWQRGTSLGPVTTSDYVADRWMMNASGATITTSRQSFAIGQTDVTGYPTYYARCEATVADNLWGFTTRLENFIDLSGIPLVLSFWAKADSSHKMRLTLQQDYGSGGSADESKNNSNFYVGTTWQKYVWPINSYDITGKTIGTAPNFRVFILIEDNTTGIFDLANVKLEKGSQATAFEKEDYSIELMKCQRYYEKSYDVNVAPGTIDSDGSLFFRASSAETLLPMPSFMTTKRATPTVTIYSTNTGASGNVYNGSTASDVAVSSVNNIGFSRARYITLGAAVADGNAINWHYTADAEL